MKFALLFVLALFSVAPCEGGGFVKQSVALVPTGQIVTQFATPVGVPVFASPVAPQSFVQYGTQSLSTPRTDLAEVKQEIAELKAMLVDAAKSGAITGLNLPNLVRKSCGQCHGPVDPKAGLDLSTLDKLTPEQRLKAIDRMLQDDPAGRMPPADSNVKLSAEDLGKLIQEFTRRGEAEKPAKK